MCDSAGGAGGAGGDPVLVAAERAAGDSAAGAGGAGRDPVLVAAAEAAGDAEGVGGQRRPRSGGGRGGAGGGSLCGWRQRRSGGCRVGDEEVSSRDSVRSRGCCGSVLLHFCGDCSISVPSRPGPFRIRVFQQNLGYLHIYPDMSVGIFSPSNVRAKRKTLLESSPHAQALCGKTDELKLLLRAGCRCLQNGVLSEPLFRSP